MKERLQHIIKAESLTNLQFAQIVEISPASVTHLLAGRNNPSIEIVAKIARRFPHYNLRWLILGEGSIYTSSSQTTPTPQVKEELPFAESCKQPSATNPEQSSMVSKAEGAKLIVCFPDGTYQEYTHQ